MGDEYVYSISFLLIITVQTDGPGFSLCAVPLELSGPGFCSIEQRLGERAEVWRYTRLEMSERTCRERGKELR